MDYVSLLFSKTVAVGFIVGIISLYSISRQKSDLNMILLTDLVEYGMLVIIAAIGSDLAEALILPGLVVGMAELLAVTELFISRNDLRKHDQKKKSKLLEEFTIKETPNLDISFSKMEVLYTTPKFFAFVLVVYGAILSGFTGGAVMASGLLFFVLAKRATGEKILPENLRVSWEGISAFSGIAWAVWILGFIGFFLFPSKWPYFLVIAGFGLALKVGSKLGLIGELFE
ncbi:EhaG family protein [Methanococcus sp. CF]